MTKSDDITRLRRPRLLIRAARFGLAEYDRTRTLARIFGAERPPERALDPLMAREAEIEQHRLKGDASYSVSRHVEILVALMDEACRALTPQASHGV